MAMSMANTNRQQEVSLQTFHHMKQIMSPFCYSKGTKHPSVSSGAPSISQGAGVRGRISEDCKFSYTFNGNIIRCFPIINNLQTDYIPRGYAPLAMRTAGYAFHGSIIRCVTEIPSHLFINSPSGVSKLLIGIDCGTTGALVIFDPISASPLQSIALRSPVTSVTVLSQLKNVDQFPPSQFYNEAMLAMVGIAAVGLLGGDVILVDLGLDDLQRRLSPREAYIIENYDSTMFTVVQVDPHDPNIAAFRHQSIADSKLIYLTFDDPVEIPNDEAMPEYFFYFVDIDGGIIPKEKNRVSISAMKYIPNCGYLVVGFDFGLFQIWDVSDMTLIFSSPIQSEGDLNIHSFEFQIPMDDPRNFAYLWVLLGDSSTDLSPGRVEFYTMEFRSKHDVDNQSQQIFLELKSCGKRLSIPLGDCYHLEVTHENRNYYKVRPLRIWTLPCTKESIVFITWEAVTFGTSYVGIFDLNQWYSAHTPEQVEIGGEQLSSFWTAVCVNNQEQISRVYDLKIKPKSLARWFNPYRSHDIHFFPSSLTFQGICLTSTETYMFEHYGVQEKLIRWIQRDGYAMMPQPSIMHDLCHNFGMIPYCTPMVEIGLSENQVEQYYLLTVFLENYKSPLIVQMANHWLDGTYANVGCGFNLILDWIKWLTMYSRCCAEQHWTTMLLQGEKDVVPETYNFLEYSRFLWNQLLSLVNILLRPIEFDDDESEDTENLRFGVTKLANYSGALLFLSRAKLLPVPDNEDYNDGLRMYYNRRRKEMKSRFDSCPYFSPQDRGGHTLLVDYLFENLDEDFLREDWETEDTIFYPPKHPRYILNFMLGNWIHVPQKHIARIIYYYVLDLVHFSVSSNPAYVNDLESLLPLSTEDKKYITLLWKIDHEDYSEAITSLQLITLDDERHELPWSAAAAHLAVCGYEDNIINKIRRGPFPAKLSRFMLNVVCEKEPQNEDLVAFILQSFTYDHELLESLFKIADSKGRLDTFIANHSCFFRPSMKDFVAYYLNCFQRNMENEIRLLQYYIIMENLKCAIDVYKRIVVRCGSDRRALSEPIRTTLESVEQSLRRLYKETQDPFDPRIRNVDEEEQRASIYEKPRPLELERMDKTVKVVRAINSPDYKLLPPVFRKLMKGGFEMKPGQTPMSPLRRYVGRAHRALPVLHSPVPTPQKVTPYNENVSDAIVPVSVNESLRTPPDQQQQAIDLNILELLRTPVLKSNIPTGSSESNLAIIVTNDVDMMNQENEFMDSTALNPINKTIKSSMKSTSVLLGPSSNNDNQPISVTHRRRSNVSFAVAPASSPESPLAENDTELEEDTSIIEATDDVSINKSSKASSIVPGTSISSPRKYAAPLPLGTCESRSRSGSEPKQIEEENKSIEEITRPKRKRYSSGPSASSLDTTPEEYDSDEYRQAPKLRRGSSFAVAPSISPERTPATDDTGLENDNSMLEATAVISVKKSTNKASKTSLIVSSAGGTKETTIKSRRRSVSKDEESYVHDVERDKKPSRSSSRQSPAHVTTPTRELRSSSEPKQMEEEKSPEPVPTSTARSSSVPKQIEVQTKSSEERKKLRRKRSSSGPTSSSFDTTVESIVEEVEDNDESNLAAAGTSDIKPIQVRPRRRSTIAVALAVSPESTLATDDPELENETSILEATAVSSVKKSTKKASKTSLIVSSADDTKETIKPRRRSVSKDEQSYVHDVEKDKKPTRSSSRKSPAPVTTPTRALRSQSEPKQMEEEKTPEPVPISTRQLRSRSVPKQTEEPTRSSEERKKPRRKRSSTGPTSSSFDTTVESIAEEDEDNDESNLAAAGTSDMQPIQVRSRRRYTIAVAASVSPESTLATGDTELDDDTSILEATAVSSVKKSTKKSSKTSSSVSGADDTKETTKSRRRSVSKDEQSYSHDVEKVKKPSRSRKYSAPVTTPTRELRSRSEPKEMEEEKSPEPVPTSTRQLRSRSVPKQVEEQKRTSEERKRPRRTRSNSGPSSSSLDTTFVTTPEDDDDDSDEYKQAPKLRRHLKGFNYSPGLSTVEEVTETSSMMGSTNTNP